MSDLGSWVCMYDDHGAPWSIVVQDEPRIDAGVSAYLSSAGTRDSLLDLTTIEGFPLRIWASEVHSWFVSTPEARYRSVELTKLQNDERDENKAKAGLWDDGD